MKEKVYLAYSFKEIRAHHSGRWRAIATRGRHGERCRKPRGGILNHKHEVGRVNQK